MRALLRAGATIQNLYMIGEGRPHLIVGFGGKNYLLYIKGPKSPKPTDKLSPSQEKWSDLWRGHWAIVKDEMEALTAIGAL